MTPMALNRYVKRKRRMTEPLFQNSHTQKKKEKKKHARSGAYVTAVKWHSANGMSVRDRTLD
jgi:hypothetical protein